MNTFSWVLVSAVFARASSTNFRGSLNLSGRHLRLDGKREEASPIAQTRPIIGIRI